MSVAAYIEVEETLLLLAETRERAERGAEAVASGGGPEHVVDALRAIDRELLALHRRLLDDAVFHVEGTEPQLALDAA